MPWCYAAADVLIVTSVTEGGPSSAKEALACGLPVVSVPVGDQDLFREAPEAMFEAAATPDALADALRNVLARPWPRRSALPPDLHLDRAAVRLVAVYQEAREAHGRST
jgi:glycosyltransferase involved in cell wall biosynthesis